MECSRICVKNLPRHLQDSRFREHFAGVGHVTDARIIRTKDGKSRQMGFVGYKTAEEAQAAVRYFHHSYIDTSRLEVEMAYRAGDASLPRPWSRYSEGSSAKQHALATGGEGPGKKGASEKGAKGGKSRGEEVDEAFKEFLAVVAPRRSAKVWGNDTTDTAAVAATAAAAQKKGRDADAGGHDGAAVFEDEDRGAGGSDGEEQYEDLVVNEGDRTGGAKDAVVLDAKVSDLDYLKSRVRKNFDDEDEDEDEEEEEDGDGDDDDGGGGEGGTSGEEEEMEEDGEGDDDDDDDDDESREEDEDDGERDEEEGAERVGKGKKEKEGKEGKSKGAKAGQANGAAKEESLASKLRKCLGEEEPEPADTDAARRNVSAQEEEGAAAGGGVGAAAEEEEEDPLESGRLFVRNLPYTADEEELAAAFSPFGELSSVHVLTDRLTKQSKGLAYVTYLLPENARAALSSLDRSVFQGRILHVLPAQRAPERPAPDDASRAKGGATSSFKADKEARDKAREVSGAAARSWNSLFMRADTVADAVAKLYGVSKAELLDPSASDVAVRLALGETHVIMETKRQLAEAGVNVVALERAADAAGSGAAGGKAAAPPSLSSQSSAKGSSMIKRSGHVILVKNIPYDTSEEEVVRLFHKYGSLGRVVLPGTKTIALVEFVDPADARKAFKATVFKRFKHVPLYLEWAPENIFMAGPTPVAPTTGAATAAAGAASSSGNAEGRDGGAVGGGKGSKGSGTAVGGKGNKVASVDALLAPADAGGVDDAGAEEERTLFVKNLAFATTSEGLRKHFVAAMGEAAVKAAVVKMKPGKKEGSQLSMGFGFVELASHAAAKSTLSKLQGSLLDGHALKLDFAQSHGKGAASAGNKAAPGVGKGAKSATKFIIRNIPFQADKKEVRQLFSTFGQLKSLRMPNKFDGSHRGFGFVEFLTQKEASNAFEAIRSTHLYGRHLVLEPANEGETLEELRARTKTQYDDAEVGGKRKKQKLGSADVFEDPNFAFSQFEN
eukprot:jgi/Mesvir1/13131/Mv06103-RA.1